MRTAKTLIRLGDAQADLSLRWAHRSFWWFCHAAAYLRYKTLSMNLKNGLLPLNPKQCFQVRLSTCKIGLLYLLLSHDTLRCVLAVPTAFSPDTFDSIFNACWTYMYFWTMLHVWQGIGTNSCPMLHLWQYNVISCCISYCPAQYLTAYHIILSHATCLTVIYVCVYWTYSCSMLMFDSSLWCVFIVLLYNATCLTAHCDVCLLYLLLSHATFLSAHCDVCLLYLLLYNATCLTAHCDVCLLYLLLSHATFLSAHCDVCLLYLLFSHAVCLAVIFGVC